MNTISTFSVQSTLLTDDTVTNLNKISKVIDDIAPIKIKSVSGKQKTLWQNTMQLKRQCGKAERRWRKTKLQVLYDILRDSLHIYNLELKNARQSFFSKSSANMQIICIFYFQQQTD